MMIEISDSLSIDDAEIQETFVRSSGPGGQHVNKVATAVQIRFDVAHTPSLPESVRARLMRLGGNRLTEDGMLVITAGQYRSQHRNRIDARNRLIGLIRRAAEPPKQRRKTRPTHASRRRRLENKRRRSETKRLRRPPEG